MRTQSGTTSLRSILYIDEVFGYLPPLANPPSKTPLLTLLKQARAFGLGIVLATQNPVDLDYKAISNAGTWFLGRLQTERDKARVMDGLEGASLSGQKQFDRKHMEQMLSALGNRVFLMNNVHDDSPAFFETRWALSYLRGPLTREQIKVLVEPLKNHQKEVSPLQPELSFICDACGLFHVHKRNSSDTSCATGYPSVFFTNNTRINQRINQAYITHILSEQHKYVLQMLKPESIKRKMLSSSHR